MNFTQFSGHKKTTETLLNNIKSISKTQSNLIENLNSLKIFNSCTPVKNKIHLDESSNSIKMKISSKGGKNITASFPNIFGRGEYCKINFQSVKDGLVEIGKPLFIGNIMTQTSIIASRNTKEINDKEVEIKRIEIGNKFPSFNMKTGFEKIQKLDVFYNQIILKVMGVKIDSKMGVTKTDKNIPFMKIIAHNRWSFTGDRLFLDLGVKFGKIFGQTSLVEKFFLGDSLKGYKKESIGPVNQNKKIGGNSFIELKGKLGLFIKKIELFAFGEVGVNSVKGFRECGDILMNFGDNNCIGKSIGVGVSLKDRRGPSFIFAMPLTTNPEAEKYFFGVDFEF